jgi:hypothetical protein
MENTFDTFWENCTYIKAPVRSRVTNKWNTDSKEKDWETLTKRNSETAKSRKAEVTKFRINKSMISLANIRKGLIYVVDSNICNLCNIGIQDREHLRSCLVLQDKVSEVDNFELWQKLKKNNFKLILLIVIAVHLHILWFASFIFMSNC